MTTVRFLRPIGASLLTALLAEVLPGVLMYAVGFSESLRICLQSSYSRPCGGYRRLPSADLVESAEGKCRLIFQFIAYTPDAFDLDGRITLEVISQAGDIDIETAEIEVVVVAPEFLQEG